MKYQWLCIVCLVLALVYLTVPARGNFWPTIAFGEISPTDTSIAVFPKHMAQQALSVKGDEPTNDLVFVGDVLLARNVESLMTKNGSDYPYRGIDFSTLALQPFVVGNFEAVVPEVHQPTKIFKLNFSVDKQYLSAVKSAGFSAFSLANNHSHDFGLPGLANTKKELTANELAFFGNPDTLDSNSVTLVTVDKQRVAVIAIHAIEQLIDEQALSEVFEYANEKSEIQIIFIHWGIEYSQKHSTLQRKAAEQLVSAGADLIIGHHPHVVQDVDLINGVPIFYSLGNYIFDQYFTAAVQQGLILTLNLTDGPFIFLTPVTSEGSLSQPQFMTPAKQAAFLRDLARRSDEKLFDDIKAGSIPLNIRVATSSKIAMMK